MMIFGIIGILLIIYLLFKTDMFGKRSGTFLEEDNDDALDVLKKRYAEGSISHEEYIQMRDAIKE